MCELRACSQVHAKAYKLLAKLASHLVGPGMEAAQHQAQALWQECDTQKRGGLSLPELAR